MLMEACHWLIHCPSIIRRISAVSTGRGKHLMMQAVRLKTKLCALVHHYEVSVDCTCNEYRMAPAFRLVPRSLTVTLQVCLLVRSLQTMKADCRSGPVGPVAIASICFHVSIIYYRLKDPSNPPDASPRRSYFLVQSNTQTTLYSIKHASYWPVEVALAANASFNGLVHFIPSYVGVSHRFFYCTHAF